MDKLVVNESNINNYDSYMKKARAIVLNEKNEIYICNMNNTYLLPGGTVEDNESTFQTLIRELKEELGLAMVINPEAAAAAEIDRVLRFPSAIKIDTFVKGKVEMLKFRLPDESPLIGCAVKDTKRRFTYKIYH